MARPCGTRWTAKINKCESCISVSRPLKWSNLLRATMGIRAHPVHCQQRPYCLSTDSRREPTGPKAAPPDTATMLPNGNVLVAGGRDGTQAATASAEIFAFTKDDCKKDEWQNFTMPPGPFKDQGQCVSFFAKQGVSN